MIKEKKEKGGGDRLSTPVSVFMANLPLCRSNDQVLDCLRKGGPFRIASSLRSMDLGGNLFFFKIKNHVLYADVIA